MIIKEGNSTIVIRIQDGENLMESLKKVCKNYKVESAIVSGVGLFKSTELAYWNGSEYVTTKVDKMMEVLSLEGNIGTNEYDGEPVIHLHVSLAGEDYTVIGGHLMDAIVYNGEIFINKLHNITLLRKKEPSGLNGLIPA